MDAKGSHGVGALVLAAALWALWALPGAAPAAQRVALVIGNGAYAHVPFLAKPGNDARAVGDAFERLGYAVTRLEDAGYDALRRGLLDFTRAASASEVAVVFYAGHGMEVDGRNFLVPVDAKLAHVDDVTYEAVPLNLVTRAVGGARRLGLVMLDACRDNPFVAKLADAGSTRSIGRGLAPVAPSGGTLVAYAAEHGKSAADGDGRNSPYTAALLRYLEAPGLDVERLFDKVRAEVERSTGGSQTPIEYGKPPDADIYLASGAPSPAPKTTAASAAGGTLPPSSGDAERAYEQAERLGTVAGYRALIRRYPGSIWADLARVQIAGLEKEPQVVVGGAPEVDVPPAAPTPDAVETGLDLSREEKRLVQMGLAAAGYSPGLVDGKFGGRTRRALRAWQESKEVEGTGYLTREQSEGLVALGREESERRRAEAEERRKSRGKSAQAPGTKLRDCPGCPEMVVVPGGKFGRPFAVGVYEVTFGEWDACVSDRGCRGHRPDDKGWGRGRRPVMNVSWEDAQAYVRWLSGKTGKEYRLLSDAEWEYVARAGTRTEYWWGDEIGRNRANCDGCGSRWDNMQTSPVGSFSANAFGLYDVHGNVFEWVEDCYGGDCNRRVVRGGSWSFEPRFLRAAIHGGNTTSGRPYDVGFRVARKLAP